jgi:hypothetical protein
MFFCLSRKTGEIIIACPTAFDPTSILPLPSEEQPFGIERSLVFNVTSNIDIEYRRTVHPASIKWTVRSRAYSASTPLAISHRR